MIAYGLFATLFAIAFWTAASLMTKRLATIFGNFRTTIMIVMVGFLPYLLLILLNPSNLSIGYYNIFTSALSGVFLFMGFLLVYKSLETEQLTNTTVLSEIQAAVFVLFGLFVLGQHINIIEGIGILAIFAGALFIIITKELKLNRFLLPALFANFSFTAFWLLMENSIEKTGNVVTPLAISRIVAIAIVILYVLLFMPIKPTKTAKGKLSLMLIVFVLIAAVSDAFGDLSFGTVIQVGFFTLGSALTALFPMLVAILSYFVYKDRLTYYQLFGFAIMVIGGVVLSIF